MIEKKGSITAMLCLVLVLMIALVGASLQSVQVAAGRALVANAVDVGLYSTFASYHKDLLETYDLFFLDSGYGQGKMRLATVLDQVEQGTQQELEYGLTPAQVTQSAITGYVLATDQGGAPFKKQVVTQMKETLGSQGLSYLLGQAQVSKKITEEQGQWKEKMDQGDVNEQYDQQLESLQEETAPEEMAPEETEPEETVPEETAPVINPITVIRTLMQQGILGLVVEDVSQLSIKAVDLSLFPSKRTLSQGIGIHQETEQADGVTSNLLFQSYLLEKCSNYTKSASPGPLDYQVEYILGGAENDTENLKKVVHRLLLVREASNTAYLYMEPAKRAQASTLALTLATAIGIPGAVEIVEALLLLCWAYGESLLDVRELLAGGKIPLVKETGSWKLELDRLAELPQILENPGESEREGLDYAAYLRILLLGAGGETQVLRSMDMVEAGIRMTEENQGFCIDACIESMEIELCVKGVRQKQWNIVRSYGYDM